MPEETKAFVDKSQNLYERAGAIILTTDICVACIRSLGPDSSNHRAQLFEGKIKFEGNTYSRIVCNVCLECGGDADPKAVVDNIPEILNRFHFILTL